MRRRERSGGSVGVGGEMVSRVHQRAVNEGLDGRTAPFGVLWRPGPLACDIVRRDEGVEQGGGRRRGVAHAAQRWRGAELRDGL